MIYRVLQILSRLFGLEMEILDTLTFLPFASCFINGVLNSIRILATLVHQIMDDSESYEEAPFRVRGSYLTCVERMDEEFVKVLKGCDAHTHEYVERLKVS